MKAYLKLSLLLIFLSSCNSEIRNDRIGLYVKTGGLKPTEINAYANQALKRDKTIRLGEELTIELLGIDDFTADKDGRVFIGGENTLIDADNNILFYVEDYFKKYELTGVSTQDAKSLKFNIKAGKPMIKDSTYRFLFKLWDKKSDKELKGNIELILK